MQIYYHEFFYLILFGTRIYEPTAQGNFASAYFSKFWITKKDMCMPKIKNLKK